MLIILDEAEREFSESIAYYEAKEAGLGRRFRNEVVAAGGGGRQNSAKPGAASIAAERDIAALTCAFSLIIAYVIRDDAIWIVAIAHGYRRPEFWVGRMRE